MTTSTRVRWIVPVAALGVALAVPALVRTTAVAETSLPPITAQALLERVIQAKPVALQGEVNQTMNLGLPELPGSSQRGSSLEPMNLATGSHTWRVWYDGDQSSRLALVDGTSEAAVIKNRTDLWLWSSADREAVHYPISAHTSKTGDQADPTRDLPVTPADAAKRALAVIDPTTTVAIAGTTKVAGVAAYNLTLTPKSGTTLVKQVSIAVDGATSQPLRVQVFSTRSSSPAISIGFTSLSYTKPSSEMFTFKAPAGTKVTEATQPGRDQADHDKRGKRPTKPAPRTTPDQISVVGEGWSSVVIAPQAAQSALPAELGGLVDTLPRVSGTWGSGRIWQGTLVTVVLVESGKRQGSVAVGAVPAAALTAALS